MVEVRPWREILETLDANGALEGLPFMPEMLSFCGRRFRVSRCLERTCEDTEGTMRRIRGVVFLEDLRCDGSAHGGCQKGCMIFWKEAWLRPAPEEPEADASPNGSAPRHWPFPCSLPGGRFTCQSTALIRASTPLSPLDPGTYFRDIRAGTYSPWRLCRLLAYAWRLRIRSILTGISHRVVKGALRTTPVEAMNLEPGEWVQVKPQAEIAATLDRNGKNRGLAFTIEMTPFCGREFRVLRRIERMVYEPTGKLIDLKNTVILDGVVCDGCHSLRGGCPRANYHFWREAWLRRVNPAVPSAACSGSGQAEATHAAMPN